MIYRDCNSGNPYTRTILKKDFDLSFDIAEYKKVEVEFYFDGHTDDSVLFYMNNTLIHSYGTGFYGHDWDYYSSHGCPLSYIKRGQTTKTVNVLQNSNNFSIVITNAGGPAIFYVYSCYIQIKTYSK